MKVGDKVRFLNEEGGGIIQSFPDKESALVAIPEGFEFVYPLTELVLEDISMNDDTLESSEMMMDKIRRDSVADSNNVTLLNSGKKGGRFPDEVDLHIPELLDDYKNLSNSEILNIQVSVFRRSLEHAIQSKFQEITFIHGIGNGVLKNEIRRILNDEYSYLQFEDASYHRYGYGATMVML